MQKNLNLIKVSDKILILYLFPLNTHDDGVLLFVKSNLNCGPRSYMINLSFAIFGCYFFNCTIQLLYISQFALVGGGSAGSILTIIGILNILPNDTHVPA